jgi:hypothetical protein
MPAMRKPVAIGALLFAALPFLSQSPSYVLGQYVDCAQMLCVAHDLGRLPQWPHVFGLLRFCGCDLPATVETGVRVAAAGGTLALCRYAIWKMSIVRSAEVLFASSAVYLMLFNPRTEANTYVLLAPAIGFTWYRAIRCGRRGSALLCLIASILILSNYELGKYLHPGQPAVVLAPLACLVWVVVVLAPSSSLILRRALLRVYRRVATFPFVARSGKSSTSLQLKLPE